MNILYRGRGRINYFDEGLGYCRASSSQFNWGQLVFLSFLRALREREGTEHREGRTDQTLVTTLLISMPGWRVQ